MQCSKETNMNRIFIVGAGTVNVDNEADAQRLLESGARELTPEEIAAAGMTGYENAVSPANTVVHADGTISFTPPSVTVEEMQREFTDAIQRHLDNFARTRNYDNIMSVATYATSTVPKFAAEGQYAVEARDATWAKGYEILDAVLSGQRPVPTIEEVIAELPPLEWPEVAA